MMSFRTLSLAWGIAPLATFAQFPLVDIGLFDNGLGQLEVRLRPDGDFDEYVSQVQFTIRWDASSSAELGTVTQVMPEQAYLPTSQSGVPEDSAGYRYQVFFGLGTMPLTTFGTSWIANQEIVLLTIPVLNGTSTFEIVNDAWTHPAIHNGDYYLSLNGLDQTGVIYQISTGVVEPVASNGWSLDVLPNPTDGPSTITIAAPEGSGQGELDLINTAGQIVWSRSFNALRGTLRSTIDLTPFEAGVYTVRLRCADQVLTQRVVRR